jgi:hypothetical protein
VRPTAEMALGSIFQVNYGQGQRRPWTSTDDPSLMDPGMALAHPLTMAGIVRGAYNTYFRLHWDEAWRHSQENAHAMLLDDHLGACYRELYDACLDRPWHLEPDSPKDPAQKAVADGVAKVIRATPFLDTFNEQLLMATWYGRYANQVEWQWKEMDLPAPTASPTFPGGGVGGVKARCLCVKRHLPVNGDKVGFTFDHHPTVRINGAYASRFQRADVLTDNLGYSLVLRGGWRQRFILHKHRPFDPDFQHVGREDAIHGVGDRSWLYFSWWTVNEFFSAIIDGIDRYGLGFVAIKFAAGNVAAEAAADKFARDYSRRAVVKVPVSEGMAQDGVEVVESPTASMQILLELAGQWQARQERYVIGQTTGGMHRQPSAGGGDVADLSGDTKYRRVRRIRLHLDESLTGSDLEPGLVSMVKKFTFPDFADLPLRLVSDMAYNPVERLTAAKLAWDMGADLKKEEVYQASGFSVPSEGDEVLENPEFAQAELMLQQQAMQQEAAGEGGEDGGFGAALAPDSGPGEVAA